MMANDKETKERAVELLDEIAKLLMAVRDALSEPDADDDDT